MVSSKKERRVPLSSISEELEKGISGTDTERRVGLERLMKVRTSKGNFLNREKLRLTKKLGPDHPRVIEVTNKIGVNRGLIRDIEVEVEHAGADIPRADENTWILHGFVRDKNLKGLPNLTVALYDEKGNWIRQLGYACTDKPGYFKLSYSRTKEDVDKPEITTGAGQTKAGRELFIHVLDQNGIHLCTDVQSITPELGRVDYREIILGDDVGICKPPIDSDQPTPGPKPEPTPEPEKPKDFKLEDIKGIGRERARRLRDAGIRDLKTFLQTDESRLKDIMGGVNIGEMKKEASSLLERMK